jgi:hypothetical protein
LKAEEVPNSTRELSRRGFVARLAVASLALALPDFGATPAAEPPKLNPNDPSAKTIGYTEDASKIDPKKEPLFKAKSRCDNCTFFQSTQAKGDYAPCTIFANQMVVGKGWCRAWSAKA